MGLKEEQSVLQLLNEGFFIESRYRAGNPFNEGFFFRTRSNGGSSDPPDCPARCEM